MALNPLIKITARNNMTPPTTKKGVSRFIGPLHNYNNTSEILSH